MQRFQKISKKVVDTLSTGKAKILGAVGAVGVASTNSFAALTSADVDMAGASSDITLVFLAILGVLVTVFGYKLVMRFLGR